MARLERSGGEACPAPSPRPRVRGSRGPRGRRPGARAGREVRHAGGQPAQAGGHVRRERGGPETGRYPGAIVPVSLPLGTPATELPGAPASSLPADAHRHAGHPAHERAATPAVPGLPPAGPKEGRERRSPARGGDPGQGRGPRGETARPRHRAVRSRRRRGRPREARQGRTLARAATLRGALHVLPPEEDAGEHRQLGRRSRGPRARRRGLRPDGDGPHPRVERQATRPRRRGPRRAGREVARQALPRRGRHQRLSHRARRPAGGLPGGLQPHRERPPAAPATNATRRSSRPSVGSRACASPPSSCPRPSLPTSRATARAGSPSSARPPTTIPWCGESRASASATRCSSTP